MAVRQNIVSSRPLRQLFDPNQKLQILLVADAGLQVIATAHWTFGFAEKKYRFARQTLFIVIKKHIVINSLRLSLMPAPEEVKKKEDYDGQDRRD